MMMMMMLHKKAYMQQNIVSLLHSLTYTAGVMRILPPALDSSLPQQLPSCSILSLCCAAGDPLKSVLVAGMLSASYSADHFLVLKPLQQRQQVQGIRAVQRLRCSGNERDA
jgi:hypothetical protein